MADGRCAKCNKFLDGGHKSYCKACLAAYYRAKRIPGTVEGELHKSKQAAWRAANPDKQPKYRRRSLLKNTYGLTEVDFQRMLVEQNHRCPFCRKPIKHMAQKGVPEGSAVIDHDHVTGQVRGLLCGKCNAGLGNFDDNLEYLCRAVDYLEYHMTRKAM